MFAELTHRIAQVPGVIAVVGAGVAGLATAIRLARAGRQVVILEARDRAGGRILTHPVVDGEVELGAEFIHGKAVATRKVMRQAGIERVALHGEHWLATGDRLISMDREGGELSALLALARKERGDRPVAQFLQKAMRNPAHRSAAVWMRGMLEGFDAADPERASLKSIVKEWDGDTGIEAEQGYPVGGYGGLVNHMVGQLHPERITLRLNTPVRSVRWSKHGVEIGTAAADGFSLKASAVVITVPLSLLQGDGAHGSAIHFDPPLDNKAAALGGLVMGPVHRVMIRFPQRPWDALLPARAPAGTFFHAPGQPFPTFWTGHASTGWLTAWCGGPGAAQLDALPDSSIMAYAIQSAQSFLGAHVGRSPEPVEVQFHNWQRDPWSRGSYSYVAVGGLKARKALAAPVGDVLFLAGEATDWSGEGSTVAGALASGERAAREVLELVAA